MILVSFVVPTLNAQKNLESCLESIRYQNFDQKQIEILICDGGSTDRTLQIAQKYKSKILKNNLKTGEAGKAVGTKHARGKYIALVDSDNILPSKNWLKKMLAPLKKDPSLIGSEPIKFTYRKNAGFIERYSALLGANDPYAYISGVYDRYSTLSKKWTGLPINSENFLGYLKIRLPPGQPVPTFGANGTIFRSKTLKLNLKSDYLFDIDIITQLLRQKSHPLYFAKIKVGIVHSYCESSISKFIKKQQRRIIDFYRYKPLRQFNWAQGSKSPNLKFIFYTLSLILPLSDSFKGFARIPDPAWFFHPLACLLTLFIYAIVAVKQKITNNVSFDRNNWSQ